MLLSLLQEKDIVNIKDGKKVGKIIDAKVNNEGKVEYLIIEEKKGLRGFINNNQEITITFMQIKTIGEDVILVEL